MKLMLIEFDKGEPGYCSSDQSITILDPRASYRYKSC